jgi:hypothetical protein
VRGCIGGHGALWSRDVTANGLTPHASIGLLSSSMAGATASQQGGAGEPAPHKRSALAVWRRRLVADQALEKVRSIIRVRQYELESLIEDAKATRLDDGERSELRLRLERAATLVGQSPPNDRAAANELLDKLDGMLPLLADDDRLRLMLEAELDRADTTLGEGARKRARDLLKPAAVDEAGRRLLEALVTAATRERNDRVREERITSELRQNYLTWLGTVLLLLLVGVSGVATLAARSGLWADVLLALLSGALGGTLSGVIRLRAPENRLAALKNLGLVMLVQPLVGAVGGIVLFALWKSGLLSVKGLEKDQWASVTVVAFAGGFSERLFLKGLARISGAVEQTEGSRRTIGD